MYLRTEPCHSQPLSGASDCLWQYNLFLLPDGENSDAGRAIRRLSSNESFWVSAWSINQDCKLVSIWDQKAEV